MKRKVLTAAAAAALGVAFAFGANTVLAQEDSDKDKQQQQQQDHAQKQGAQQQQTQAQKQQQEQARKAARDRTRQQQAKQAEQRLKNEWGKLSQDIETSSTFYYPTGDEGEAVVALTIHAPESVRSGQPAPYELEVENMTDQRLAGVTVVQSLSKNMEFEAAAMADKKQDGQKTSGHSQGQQRWNIGELEPGQSKTIRAVAIPQAEGQQGLCVAVMYETALCKVFDVVSPTLKIQKRGPESAYICEDFTWEYRVSNTGTGDARNVVVTDQLPQGLRTTDGEQTVEREIGTLGAGENKSFAVQFSPQQTGEFTSRASAESEAGEVRSSRVTTTVYEAELQVEARGPQWMYSNQPIDFEVTVTNNGDTAARNTVLDMTLEGAEGDGREENIGDLEVGQTKTFNITAEPDGDVQQVKLMAVATSLCETGEDEAARARAATEIRRIAALLLECVDNVDPVKVGSNTVYTIKVKNQGDAPANQVKVMIEVPSQLEVVEATGDAEAQVSGQDVTFGPVQSLAEGDVLTYQLECEATGTGDVKLRTELESEYLDSPVADVEPTRLYRPQSQ
jgi:uncharacterized repeat protein (TIGR01451 family)